MLKKRNIALMCLIALLQGMVFYAPIASLYRQAAGLTLGQIALIEGASYLFSLAMELPWGMIADRIGHRRTMIACCCFYCLSKLVFWRADGFACFLLERFILAIAVSGLSGVEESMLYLSCPEGESQRFFGLHNACGTAGLLIASGAYALFIEDDYALAAVVTMIAYALAALLSLFLTDVKAGRASAGHGDLKALIRDLLGDGGMIAFLAGAALLREAVQMVVVWFSQNQYLRCGMDGRAMGAAYIIVTLAALCGTFSQKITDRLGRPRFARLCMLAAAAACAAPVFTRSALISIACIAAANAASALIAPLFSCVCAVRAGNRRRATMLSLFALMQSSTAAIANAACGRIADHSLSGAMAACACLCLAACFFTSKLLGGRFSH